MIELRDQDGVLLMSVGTKETKRTPRYLAQDFARCASNRIKLECDSCLRNMHISPVHPEAPRQVWIGPWVLDEPCPSRVPKEANK